MKKKPNRTPISYTRSPRVLDLAGKQFERLTVLEFSCVKFGAAHWRCACSCGKVTIVTGGNLKTGHTKSCGCLEDEARDRRHAEMVKHGGSKRVEHRIWSHMRGRCNNPTDAAYENYGGRGIKVCARWDLFENFLADMGPRPEGTSIDRIDNDGDYCPENCRWATSKQQGRNKRTTVKVEWKGERLALGDFCEMMGLEYNRVYHRMVRGYTIEQAISPLDFRLTPRN